MYRNKRAGFTLLEILIVIAILLIIFFLVMLNLRTQIKRGNDIKRKTDLQKIQKAFEEYFNDKGCYPYAQVLESCNSENLSPYLKRLPCDPVTKTPYLYITGTPTLCSGYRACTKLEDTKDPDIARAGCDEENGCGFSPGYNYCVSMGFDTTAEAGESVGSGGSGGATPTPTIPPIFNGNFACRRDGQCNSVSNPQGLGCPASFPDYATCQPNCSNPAYLCP